MIAKFQLVIDCADPEPLVRFWVAVLGYEFEPPPDGYDNWDDYWRAVGVGEDELGVGLDCIVDPAGRGPRIWFQVVPEKKTLKNRLHLDITVSGGRANPIETRRRLVDAEARRLEALGATFVRALFEDGLDHYGIAMRDPEGNEFDINLRSLARRSRRAVRMRYPPFCTGASSMPIKTRAVQIWALCARTSWSNGDRWSCSWRPAILI